MATDSARKAAGKKSKKPVRGTPATGFVKNAPAEKNANAGENVPAKAYARKVVKKAAAARKAVKKTAGRAQRPVAKVHQGYTSAVVQPGGEYVLSLATNWALENQNTALLTATKTAKTDRRASASFDDVEIIGHPLLQLPQNIPAALIDVLTRVIERYQTAAGDVDEKIADALEEAPSVPSVSYLRSMRDHEELWRRLEQKYGIISTVEYGQKHSKAENISTYASRHRGDKKIVGARRRGTMVLPAYQFDDSLRPLPAMEHVIRTLDSGGWSEDSICLWMVSPTGWLEDRPPADVIGADPEAVIQAAAEEVADW